MSIASIGGDALAGAGRTLGRREASVPMRILVVGADENARESLASLLRGRGFATSTAPDGEAALAEARRATPDIVLTDLQMPQIHGLELCQRLHEIDRELPVIVMTGSSDAQAVVESFRVGVEDCLIKPLQHDAVLLRVECAIARRIAKSETEGLYRRLNERLVLSSVREQAHAEAEGQQRAQLSALLENLSEGVIIADPGGRVLMLNSAGRAILAVGDDAPDTIDAVYSTEAHDLEGRLLRPEQRPLMRALRGEPVAATRACASDRTANSAASCRQVRAYETSTARSHWPSSSFATSPTCGVWSGNATNWKPPRSGWPCASRAPSRASRTHLHCSMRTIGWCSATVSIDVSSASRWLVSIVGKSYEELLDAWIGDIDFSEEAARAAVSRRAPRRADSTKRRRHSTSACATVAACA